MPPVYRGHWCPFCQAYLKQLQSLTKSITAAGGYVLTVTAESESELHKIRETTGYDGETIVDTENLLATELRRRGIIDVAVSEKTGYPNGMAQPAVLVGTKAKVVYKWAIKPSVDRPSLKEVWENAEAEMQGKKPVHTEIPLLSFVQGLKQKLFG
ncbi:uncharacterized protein KY384_007449 [Bacidia gigantensis]|uniref:uncharacterized protein n=1 Tax=Bacidia gigantensis TaxID=2732470 RepID=UPI001D03B193|nr:uncharacterized protein KY384_007449 [Bacidia gigantensis]KAG8528531.1 hypothetical protein KY384_007449 [Bacidia gigantensis]